MQNSELITTIIELVVVIASFFVGRYILPKYKTTIQNAAAEFQVLLNYAESFVAYAREFLDVSGEEKMNAVVAKLKEICEQQNINVDEETLKAIAQKAYDAMKAGESSSKVIIETATTELKEAAGVIAGVGTLVAGVEEAFASGLTVNSDNIESIESTTVSATDEDPFEDDIK